MFIELHIIQNFAPANLNRDDTGSPKDCEFGGVRRASVGSRRRAGEIEDVCLRFAFLRLKLCPGAHVPGQLVADSG